MKKAVIPNLADRAYIRLKEDIFDFRLLPSDRFTEKEVASRLGMSRTPVRAALYRLEQEGYIQVSARSGWNVSPLDFEQLDELYDVRTVLELATVKRLCELDGEPNLEDLKAIWLVPPGQRLTDWRQVGWLDETFHEGLLQAAGNREMARIHHEVTERIRIIRRLDFTRTERIASTYEEHAKILRAIIERKSDYVQLLLRSHITASKAEVRKITLHMLHTARSRLRSGPN